MPMPMLGLRHHLRAIDLLDISDTVIPPGGSAPGAAGFTPSPHALTSAHHTGTLGDNQAPQFLKMDGTRNLTGNLTLSDGVAIGQAAGPLLTFDDTLNQLRLTGAELRVDGDLTFVGAQQISTTVDNLTLLPAGDLILDPTGLDVLPGTGYKTNLGSLAKKYLTLHAAELWVETLVAQNTLATIGGRILVGATTALTSDLAPAATTIYVKYNNLANGDRVYLEANGNVEFMSIDSAPGGVGPYSYTVTRNLDGTGANQWYAGDAVFDTGQVDSGFIDLYSLRGVKAATEYGPTIVGNVRNSLTYNDWTPHWVIGNLNGVYGYSTGLYGFAAGKYAANQPWIAADATNGFRVMRGAPGTQLAQWDTSGNILVGQAAASQSNVYITAGAVKLRTNTTDMIVLDSTGDATFGTVGAGKFNLMWDTSEGDLLLRLNTTAYFQVDGSASLLKFGSDVSAAATTGIALMGADQTYNGEALGSGDLLLGDNSASKANVLWDKSAGQLLFRGGTAAAAYVDTTGAITFGAGAGILNASGIALTGGTGATNQLKWLSGATTIGHALTSSGGGMWLNVPDVVGLTGRILIDCTDHAAGLGATLDLSPTVGLERAILGIGSQNLILKSGGSHTLSGGLNIGSATGATTGQGRLGADLLLGASTHASLQAKDASLAQDAESQIALTTNNTALVFILNASTGNVAIYGLGGGGNTTVEISDPGAAFTPTYNNAGTTNVAWSGSAYVIQNKVAATHAIRWWVMAAI